MDAWKGGDVLKWIGYDGATEASRCVSAFVEPWTWAGWGQKRWWHLSKGQKSDISQQ